MRSPQDLPSGYDKKVMELGTEAGRGGEEREAEAVDRAWGLYLMELHVPRPCSWAHRVQFPCV